MKIVLSHPTGNTFVRAAAKGFAKASLLYKFHTTIASFPGTVLYKFGKVNFLKEIQRRNYDPILQPYTKIWPWKELGRVVSLKAGLNKLTLHEKGFFSVDAVYQSLDRRVASDLSNAYNKHIDGIYAYEDGALLSFIEAKKKGITCFYDLPIGHWRSMRNLLLIEQEIRPEWASTIEGFKDSEIKLDRKDHELKLADVIITASSFTKETLRDFNKPIASIKVIPYGFPPVYNQRKYEPVSNRPLKILFVGGLSQRKGIANLFKAVEKFPKKVALTIVGQKSVQDCTALNDALKKHVWISSLPHGEILKLMRLHDVLVFPSLFEGFGLVITEAMSQGTPVITTERTAGRDIIKNGENGWLTEAGNTESLIEVIENLIEKPELIEEVGRASMNTARKRPWEIYAEELVETIQSQVERNRINEKVISRFSDYVKE